MRKKRPMDRGKRMAYRTPSTMAVSLHRRRVAVRRIKLAAIAGSIKRANRPPGVWSLQGQTEMTRTEISHLRRGLTPFTRVGISLRAISVHSGEGGVLSWPESVGDRGEISF